MSLRTAFRLTAFLAVALGAALAFAYRDAIGTAVPLWLEANRAIAPLAFLAAYALATVLFLPGSIFGLAGGALFGPLFGTLVNLAGATLGASAAFLIARHAAADWVLRRLGGRGAELMRGIDEEGWRFVAFIRLVPLFPFNLANYALGLTRIRFWHYAAASAGAMLPGVFLYTWMGYAGREAMAGGGDGARLVTIALALLAGFALLPRLVRRLRKNPSQWIDVERLSKALRAPRGTLVFDVRSREEFAGPLGHIAGAKNIPLHEMQARIGELGTEKEAAIVLVCRTHKRSEAAAAMLRSAGFSNVLVLRGGMEAWSRNPLKGNHEISFHPQ